MTPRRVSLTVIAGASLVGGVLASVVLLTYPFAGAEEHAITGALLLGWAVCWALLAVLSARLADRPERWATVPAAAMALTGVGLFVFAPGAAELSRLGWVWPPALLGLVVWMVVHARRGRSGRARPWVLYAMFAVLALVALGGAYETLATSADRTGAAGADGRLVDVGGHRLHIRCSGSGQPTVVLEPGLGESASAMSRWIAPDVARTTRVCIYDRAGHGLSEAARRPADGARDLHVLLRRARVPGPYVLAGHSLGGIFALSYAHRYPDEVAGVVLVDSMHPKESSPSAMSGATRTDPWLAVLPTLARMGLARLFFDPRDGTPAAQTRQLVRDVSEMPAELGRAARLSGLGSRPLAVITADEGSAAGWRSQQENLARLSSTSAHIVVDGATHASLVGDESDAAHTGRGIRGVVLAVRRSGGD